MSSQRAPSVSGSDASVTASNTDQTPRSGRHWFPDIPRVLPHEMVFPIQIGSELFRLSGASISSDAPSYFSQFFERQLARQEERPQIRTLYIDRDPETFRDINRHLQGYHISPRNASHFVRLFADAQFYNLPKLISQLFESEIYISIGGQPFQINRDVFQSPGNSPNFFTLGFAVFFSNPIEVFPGLDRDSLLRPPSILPPEVPNRSPQVFNELVHLLRGYPLHIRDEEHRQQLIRDCRYYSFRGLEQRLYQHSISWNAYRERFEITMRLADIKPSGISIAPDDPALAVAGYDAMAGGANISEGWIMYARPFVDDQARELILEISNEAIRLDPKNSYAEFFGLDNKRIKSLLKVIKSKLGLEISQEWPMGLRMMETMNGKGQGFEAGALSDSENSPWSGHRVKVLLDENTDLVLDGVSVRNAEDMLGRSDAAERDPAPRSFAVESSSGDDDVQNAAPSRAGAAEMTSSSLAPTGGPQRKRLKRKHGEVADGYEWIIKRGQWRLRVQKTAGGSSSSGGAAVDAGHPGQSKNKSGLEIVLVAVKLDAFTGEHGKNQRRSFLS